MANLALLILILRWSVIEAVSYKLQYGVQNFFFLGYEKRFNASRVECGVLCTEKVVCWAFNYNYEKHICQFAKAELPLLFQKTLVPGPQWLTAEKGNFESIATNR